MNKLKKWWDEYAVTVFFALMLVSLLAIFVSLIAKAFTASIIFLALVVLFAYLTRKSW